MHALRSMAYQAISTLGPMFSRLGPAEARRSIGFLVCHGVYDDARPGTLPPPSTTLSLASFRSNLRALQKTHTFVSLDEAVAMLAGRLPWRDQCAVLTFDDSLKCLVEVVAPLLQREGVPATFYLSTAAIETRRPYWWHRVDYVAAMGNGAKIVLELDDRTFVFELSRPASPRVRELKAILRASPTPRCEELVAALERQSGVSLCPADPDYPHSELMSWDDVTTLARMNMTIGSHTIEHPNLTLLSPAALAAELSTSKQVLTERTKRACDHVCYPYGAYSDAVCQAARAAGYHSAVTMVDPGWNLPGADPYRLRRFPLTSVPHKMPYLVYGLNRWTRAARRPVSQPVSV